ncbi:MAG TPA: superoxide dismutase family protein [Longimicrobiales bacterium]
MRAKVLTTGMLAVGAAIGWALHGPGTAEAPARAARAELRDADGNRVGTATFTEEANGVRVVVDVSDLRPGRHGFHIHETGRCDPPDFQSAGGHFDPEGREHGMENPAGPHAGDLPNLVVQVDGTGRGNSLDPYVTLEGGEDSLFRNGGTALVVHADPDDYYTDPSGDSGDRVACGIIERL